MNSWPVRNLSRNQMDYMFGDFEKIINGLLHTTYEGGTTFQPKCEVSETKDHFLASFDMPGVKKEDIKIEVKGNQIVISGERSRAPGKFERSFKIPDTINIEKIEAQYENGVLELAIPKAEEIKGRIIQVQSGSESLFTKLHVPKEESTKELS